MGSEIALRQILAGDDLGRNLFFWASLPKRISVGR